MLYCHLTNYSVNKKNECFIQNKKAENDNVGNKWSLSALMTDLESRGIDTNLLWSRIYDIIIKSIISVESHFFNSCTRMISKNNCFELFGYDILIDESLKPWLMEINLTPSLAVESPIDLVIKSQLIANMLTLIGLKRYDRKKEIKRRGQRVVNKGNKRYMTEFTAVLKDKEMPLTNEAINMITVRF